jgi:S-adenosylmethionine:tRNA ribosyltransferase-isomerase
MNSSGQPLHSLESYNYPLPADRIAQFPVKPRDASRLLFISRQSRTFEDSTFGRLPEYLRAGDLLVMNDTKVIPARVLCDLGEILFVREVEQSCWDCLVYPGKHFKPGTVFTIAEISAEVLAHSKNGRLIRFGGDVDALLNRHGKVPLPPYIEREPTGEDRKWYQTVYARKPGSIAAPTAGMHFTRRVIKLLKNRNIDTCKITLHVGPGTFRPVKNSDITHHHIDPEYYSCSAAAWKKIQNASRVVSVGTTTTRALETIAVTKELQGFTSLFIYPGYQFHIVQGMVTNFHLPKSSLLMLVSAFAGYELIRSAYQHAVENDYRFYSYGDATLIL